MFRNNIVVSTLLLLTTVILMGGLALPVLAQGGGEDVCPALVDEALIVVGESCADLDRDMACYGYTLIDTVFWPGVEAADLAFGQPADRVPLDAIQTIATHPLDLDHNTWGVAALHLRADVPDTLPGQAVTFLLMGDASLENAVPPAAAVEPVAATVTVVDGTNANLRSGPSTAHNVAATLESGAAVELVGVNAAGDWYEVALDEGRTAWIAAFLVEAEDTADLPVSEGRNPYGPMQSFYFTSGLGEPACHEAPDALLIQTPADAPVTLAMNDLEVQIGSTVVVTLVNVAETDQTALVIALLEGGVSVPALAIGLTEPGDFFAVALKHDGRVDPDAEIIDLAHTAVADIVRYTCDLSMNTGLVDVRSIACTVDLNIVTAPSVDDAPAVPPADDPLAGIGAADACTAAAINTVNLRGGPGTEYGVDSQLGAGQTIMPAAQVTGTDGYRWWQTPYGLWFRGDLVVVAGACGDVPVLNDELVPLPPPESPTGDGSQSGGASYVFDVGTCEAGRCPEASYLRAGDSVTIYQGCRWENNTEADAAAQIGQGSLSIDGAAVSTYYPELRYIPAEPGVPAGWEVRVQTDWTATAGTHTVVGSMPPCGTHSWTFTVAE
jgi:uncharacterized protein YgiM (DUF1202 family)